jgi:hypothetical protein
MAGNTWGESWGIAGSFAWGGSWGFEDAVAPAPAAPAILPAGSSGNYLEWWERELHRILRERKKPKKKLAPKKQELVDDLEEVLVQLREHAAEKQETDKYANELRNQVLESARLLNAVYAEQVANKRIQHEIAVLEAYLREMDDEEAFLLALH